MHILGIEINIWVLIATLNVEMFILLMHNGMNRIDDESYDEWLDRITI